MRGDLSREGLRRWDSALIRRDIQCALICVVPAGPGSSYLALNLLRTNGE